MKHGSKSHYLTILASHPDYQSERASPNTPLNRLVEKLENDVALTDEDRNIVNRLMLDQHDREKAHGKT
jgi:hypothetical protein